VAAVTHGGVTRDLLRTLLGEDDVRVEHLGEGIPACAITTLHDLEVLEVGTSVTWSSNLIAPSAWAILIVRLPRGGLTALTIFLDRLTTCGGSRGVIGMDRRHPG
jgi:hypothetical protein